MFIPRTYNAVYYTKFPLTSLVLGVARMAEEEYKSLTNSIKKEGMLNPIIVEHDFDVYTVVVGHNRCHIAVDLEWTNVEAIVITRLGGELLDGGMKIASEEFLKTISELYAHDDTWRQSHYALRCLKRAHQSNLSISKNLSTSKGTMAVRGSNSTNAVRESS